VPEDTRQWNRLIRVADILWFDRELLDLEEAEGGRLNSDELFNRMRQAYEERAASSEHAGSVTRSA
jgi:hypothetical protein